jgi:hypothetical protein
MTRGSILKEELVIPKDASETLKQLPSKAVKEQRL